jgi:hypothetical protein
VSEETLKATKEIKIKKSLRKFWRIKIKHYLCSRFERELSGQEKRRRVH